MLEIRNLEKSFRSRSDSSTRAYPWLSWEKWGRENNYFPQYLALFGLQRRDSPRWQSDHPRNLQGNWLFARRT